MKNISDVDAEKLALDIYYAMKAKDMLPKGFYLDKDEVVNEIYRCIAKMDGEYKKGPASFKTYVGWFCPDRVKRTVWRWYNELAKYENIEELDKRQYGEGPVQELATQPDYDGIELDLLLEALTGEEKTILCGMLDGRSQQSIAEGMAKSQSYVSKLAASALGKFKEALS